MSLAKIAKRVTLFDDESRADAASLRGVKSELLKEPISAMNYAACRYRPIYNFWGVNGGSATFHNDAEILRSVWVNSSPGAPGLRAKYLVVPSTDGTATVRYAKTTLSSGGFSGGNADIEDQAHVSRPKTSGESYPADAIAMDALGGHGSYYDDVMYTVDVGTIEDKGPSLYSGVVFEPMNFEPRYINPIVGDGTAPEKHQAFPTDWIGPGLPIIGTEDTTEAVGDIRSLSQMRTFFRRVYQNKRIHFAWSGSLTDGAGTPVTFSGGSTNQFRYIFNKTIGEGGTAPSGTGPGISIPTRFVGSGRNTTTRIYVSVYAELGGSNGAAQFGVYTQNFDGSMAGPVALTNGPSITTSGYAWYPSVQTAFDPSTHSYFEARTDSLRNCERILFCCRRTGTSFPNVGAFVMFGCETS